MSTAWKSSPLYRPPLPSPTSDHARASSPWQSYCLSTVRQTAIAQTPVPNLSVSIVVLGADCADRVDLGHHPDDSACHSLRPASGLHESRRADASEVADGFATEWVSPCGHRRYIAPPPATPAIPHGASCLPRSLEYDRDLRASLRRSELGGRAGSPTVFEAPRYAIRGHHPLSSGSSRPS